MNRTSHTVRLTVKSIEYDDVYKDIVRMSEASRDGLKTGRIHRFRTSAGAAYFILRGTKSKNDGKILMDEAARSKLNLEAKTEAEFEICEVGFWGELRWVWNATDPTYRIAGRLGALSFFLAIIALLPLIKELLGWLFQCI